MKFNKFLTLFLILSIVINIPSFPVATARASDGASGFIHFEAPETLTYDEIIELSKSVEPPVLLKPKLDALFMTPIVSNEAYAAGKTIELSRSDKLGQFIRVGSWNIHRGIQLDEIKMALDAPEAFKQKIKARNDSKAYQKIVEQLDVLRSVDILVLNEVDLGLKRTDYKDVAREIAQSLKMNYSYGVEFLEIDPINLGTEDFKSAPSESKREQLRQLIEVDGQRYRGLHGTVILSRFPIRRATLVPLKYQAYDWNKEEKARTSIAESARRQLSRMAFLEKTPREIRLGGRSVLTAEIEIPQLPEGAITVVATHLESRCGPKGRRRQMQEVLSLIKDIKGPVVLAGDLNTSGSDMKPTSIRSELMKRISDKNFWIKRSIKTIAPLGPAFDFLLLAATFSRTVHDPTAKGIFIFGPNDEAKLFKDLERMRFSDGYAFDFRGDAARTVNRTKGTLANSNQRAHKKGFITTHSMERNFWAVGKNKLDWILVKAYAKDPRGKNESYRLAPHFAQTLEELNHAPGQRLSDHNPITVDLPIEEPEAIGE